MPVISDLLVYPIKSCRGIAVKRARLLDTGLEYDRNWMVTDPAGAMLTQRTHPKLALVHTAIAEHDLVLCAPGMPELRIPLAAAALQPHATAIAATVWRDTVHAFDTGKHTARWFSEFLQTPACLVRFAPGARRVVDSKWTGEQVAHTHFADGFPLLVIGQASLDELNKRLRDKGAPEVPMDRFRPNLVLTGLDAHEEDYVDSLDVETESASVRINLVKLCTRCPVPTIDQRTGMPAPEWPHEPLDTMSAYRSNARFNGALTFGKNGIVVNGAGASLALGQAVEAEIGFGD
ncbi:MOSC domain-containing protein [Burkholderia sp. TSV86]|uniref:MOSC domain-containing protein n=1 Tax=Burkholderia sp. TSV86 TaxID=1385594 RepID=UPI00075655DB|nr:MOSC N-terminal beta barrel domain-containing protein [Burkholderia sp. TSV86]KVE32533.1 Fe-S protein [Burkholderia sp. TSV86]